MGVSDAQVEMIGEIHHTVVGGIASGGEVRGAVVGFAGSLSSSAWRCSSDTSEAASMYVQYIHP